LPAVGDCPAIVVVLAPQVSSDVTTTDADSKGREWYHKTKLITEGHKLYHTTLIADIKDEDSEKEIVHKIGGGDTTLTCDESGPAFGFCLGATAYMYESEALACFKCVNEAIDTVRSRTTFCTSLKEVGLCDAVDSCDGDGKACGNVCSFDLHVAVACIISDLGCTDDEYLTECLPGI
jgi:hypothetical protein